MTKMELSDAWEIRGIVTIALLVCVVFLCFLIVYSLIRAWSWRKKPWIMNDYDMMTGSAYEHLWDISKEMVIQVQGWPTHAENSREKIPYVWGSFIFSRLCYSTLLWEMKLLPVTTCMQILTSGWSARNNNWWDLALSSLKALGISGITMLFASSHSLILLSQTVICISDHVKTLKLRIPAIGHWTIHFLSYNCFNTFHRTNHTSGLITEVGIKPTMPRYGWPSRNIIWIKLQDTSREVRGKNKTQ